MSRARDIANAITVPEFSGNVEIIGTSPELTFETTNSSHYNFQISVQENVSGGLEISSGSADADSSNDTFTPRLVVLNGGNVGIGNSSPSYLLSLSSASTTQAEIKTTATNGTAQIRFTNDARTYTIGIDNNDSFFIYDATGTSSRFVVNSSGNVGIGTTSPTVLLDLESANPIIRLTDSDASGTPECQISGAGGDLILDADRDDEKASTLISFKVDGTEQAQINNAGDLILKSENKLQLNRSDNNRSMKLYTDNSAGFIQTTTDPIIIDAASGRIRFDIASSEKMRLDSSGNLLVGRTSSSGGADGIRLLNDGFGGFHRDSAEVMQVDRGTNDGTLINFLKDGSTVGSITTLSGDLAIGTSDTGLGFFDQSNRIIPFNVSTNAFVDNSIDLGDPSFRFKDFYLTGNVHITDNTNGPDAALHIEKTTPEIRLQINGNSGYNTIQSTGSNELAFGRTGTERMRIDSIGQVFVGKTAASNTTGGATITEAGQVAVTIVDSGSAQQCLFLNRQSSDGTLVLLRQANSTEGSISVSGSTVSYNGFSGLHESSGIPTDTTIGTVVSTIDELDVYSAKQEDSEEDNPKAGQTRKDHAKVKVSDIVGDKAVYGVVGSFNAQGKVNVVSVGIGSIRVTGSCEGGDLLESNGDGTAKVQSDDIIRSKTIGKVTIGNSDTSVKLVSCVLYCG